MTVVKGVLAHVTPTILLDPITKATATGTYWGQNRGKKGYINGEVLLAHPNNEDYEGARIFRESELWDIALQAAREVCPEVESGEWERGYVNVRAPGEGKHPKHPDFRRSTLILSFRFNYRGVGEAGSIIYSRPGAPSPIEVVMQHGDVGVYSGALHHVDTCQGIVHEVPANTSSDTPYVTVMLETSALLPADMIERVKGRAPKLARTPHNEITPSERLSSLVVPTKQIDREGLSRYTPAESEKGRMSSWAGVRIFADPDACRKAVERLNQLLANCDSDRGLPAAVQYTSNGSRATLVTSLQSLSDDVLQAIVETIIQLNQTAHLASISYHAQCAGRLAQESQGLGDSPKGFALLDRELHSRARRVAAVSLLLHDSPCPSHLMPRSPVCLGATPPLTLPLPDSSGARAVQATPCTDWTGGSSPTTAHPFRCSGACTCRHRASSRTRPSSSSSTPTRASNGATWRRASSRQEVSFCRTACFRKGWSRFSLTKRHKTPILVAHPLGVGHVLL
jgi:hypothetical protein